MLSPADWLLCTRYRKIRVSNFWLRLKQHMAVRAADTKSTTRQKLHDLSFVADDDDVVLWGVTWKSGIKIFRKLDVLVLISASASQNPTYRAHDSSVHMISTPMKLLSRQKGIVDVCTRKLSLCNDFLMLATRTIWYKSRHVIRKARSFPSCCRYLLSFFSFAYLKISSGQIFTTSTSLYICPLCARWNTRVLHNDTESRLMHALPRYCNVFEMRLHNSGRHFLSRRWRYHPLHHGFTKSPPERCLSDLSIPSMVRRPRWRTHVRRLREASDLFHKGVSRMLSSCQSLGIWYTR